MRLAPLTNSFLSKHPSRTRSNAPQAASTSGYHPCKHNAKLRSAESGARALRCRDKAGSSSFSVRGLTMLAGSDPKPTVPFDAADDGTCFAQVPWELAGERAESLGSKGRDVPVVDVLALSVCASEYVAPTPRLLEFTTSDGAAHAEPPQDGASWRSSMLSLGSGSCGSCNFSIMSCSIPRNRTLYGSCAASLSNGACLLLGLGTLHRDPFSTCVKELSSSSALASCAGSSLLDAASKRRFRLNTPCTATLIFAFSALSFMALARHSSTSAQRLQLIPLKRSTCLWASWSWACKLTTLGKATLSGAMPQTVIRSRSLTSSSISFCFRRARSSSPACMLKSIRPFDSTRPSMCIGMSGNSSINRLLLKVMALQAFVDPSCT
mmetsp:Transcript_39014/g.107440  ORF Transcript_39014/g.107440 Transcript_39014/m.107440 type:complete len:380 (-) Transcript_39014:288-1427(-)